MSTAGTQFTDISFGTNFNGFSVMSGYLFAVSSFPGNNTLYKINLQNPSSYTTYLNGSNLGYSQFTNDGTYLYFTNYQYSMGGGAVRYNINGVLDNTWSSSTSSVGLSGTTGICIDGNYIYVTYNSLTYVTQIDISNGSIVTSIWATLPSRASDMLVLNGYMYINCDTNGSICKIKMNYTTNPPTADTIVNNFINIASSLTSYLNTLFLNIGGNNIGQYNATTGNQISTITGAYQGNRADALAVANINGRNYLFNANVNIYQYLLDLQPCFKEGTKILTDKGYIQIEHLKKGDLVKTLLHGFLRIDTIGKKDMEHPATSDRSKDQLYKCSCSLYPELLEDLVLTGSHSILVDGFQSDEQRKKTFEILGDIYITDNKYRLPACVDEKASVYETPGTYTIYHLALENVHYTGNYGIYANGLLVETCSKRYLRELSNMELIECL
jgi:hypothetical protein